MHDLSTPRFMFVIALDLIFIWIIAEVGGWAGFGLLFVGIGVLGLGALRWGADSRDGANWVNRSARRSSGRALDDEFVDEEITRLEHQFRRRDDGRSGSGIQS